MENILLLIGIVAAWFVLQKYILPRFGISTWLSSSCSPGDRGADKDKETSSADDEVR